MPTPAEVMVGRRLNELSLWRLANAFDCFHTRWSAKIAVEAAFALALGIKRASDSMGSGFADKKLEYLSRATEYAKMCIKFFSGLPANTLEDVAPDFVSLVGVTLPEKFYLEYIRDTGRFPEFTELLQQQQTQEGGVYVKRPPQSM